MTASVGSVVGSHRLEAVIGAGPAGVVYRATHVRLGRPAAVKVLAPAAGEDEDARARFLEQVTATAGHRPPERHPDPRRRRARGRGVRRHALRRRAATSRRSSRGLGALDPELLTAVLGPVAGALDAAHEEGVVHGDVKPSNVLLEWSRDGSVRHVYLSDFGMAARVPSDEGLSRVGPLIDRFDYLAPEQVEERDVGPAADVYALGCVTFHALTGRAPFGGRFGGAVLHGRGAGGRRAAERAARRPARGGRRPGAARAGGGARTALRRGRRPRPRDRRRCSAARARARRAPRRRPAVRVGRRAAPRRPMRPPPPPARRRRRRRRAAPRRARRPPVEAAPPAERRRRRRPGGRRRQPRRRRAAARRPPPRRRPSRHGEAEPAGGRGRRAPAPPPAPPHHHAPRRRRSPLIAGIVGYALAGGGGGDDRRGRGAGGRRGRDRAPSRCAPSPTATCATCAARSRSAGGARRRRRQRRVRAQGRGGAAARRVSLTLFSSRQALNQLFRRSRALAGAGALARRGLPDRTLVPRRRGDHARAAGRSARPGARGSCGPTRTRSCWRRRRGRVRTGWRPGGRTAATCDAGGGQG